MVGSEYITIEREDEVTGEVHGRLDIILQEMLSPLLMLLLVKVLLLFPASSPLTSHWYEGLPPLSGTAVNVTDVPLQTAFAEAVTLTDGVKGAVTFMVMLLLAALPVAQGALLVIVQLITSPFAREPEE